jgi:cell volume regulation protein A
MFVILGLLSFPHRLLDAAGPGLLLAGVLLLVARPLAVALSLVPFRFSPGEMAFVSWAGLRGAVPIILATYPLLRGVENAGLIFDVVFFAVVVSVLAQGLTIPWVARRLGLEVPAGPAPPVSLEITSLKHVDSDIVDYAVEAGSRAAGRPVRALALPEGAVIAMIARGREVVPPRGSTRIEADDHVFVVLRPEVRAAVDRVFAGAGEAEAAAVDLAEFPLHASTTAGEVAEFYGIDLAVPAARPLGAVLAAALGPDGTRVGAWVDAGAARLTIRTMEGERIEEVGFAILPPQEDEAPD